MQHDKSFGDPITGEGYRSKVFWTLGEWPRETEVPVINSLGKQSNVKLTRELMSRHPKFSAYVERVIIQRRIHDYL